jgi:hypothetical protein
MKMGQKMSMKIGGYGMDKPYLSGYYTYHEEFGGHQKTGGRRLVLGAGQRLASSFQAPNETRSRDGSAPFKRHRHRHAEKYFSASRVAMGLN